MANIGDVNVKITSNAKQAKEELGAFTEHLKTSSNEARKLDNLSFAKVKSSLSGLNSGLKSLQSNFGGSFNGGKKGAKEVTEEVKETERQLAMMTPQLDDFRSRLELMTIAKLNKELTIAEAEFNKINTTLADLEALMAYSNDPDWVATFRQQIAELAPASDEALIKIKMIEEQIRKVDGKNIKDVTSSIREMGVESRKAMADLNKSFKKGFRSVKRFAIGLIGLRTFWALLTRSMRTYLNANDEFNSKIQGLLQGIAQIFAPLADLAVKALQTVIRWISIALAYIFTFVNAIFGTTIGINLSAKNMKDLTQRTKAAAKEANKMLAPFDELNVLSEGASPSGLDTGYVAPDFSGFDISDHLEPLAKFNEFLEKNRESIKLITIAVSGLIGILAALAIVLGLINLLTSPITATFLAIALLVGTAVWVASIWDTLSQGQQVALIILGLVTVIGILTLGVWAFNTAIAANPIGLIIIAIAALLALVAYMIVHWDDLKAAILDMAIKAWNAIKGFFGGIWDGLVSIGTFFGTIWSNIKTAFALAIVFLITKWESFKIWIWNGLTAIGTFFGTIWTGIGNFISGIWTGVKNAFSGVITFMSNILTGIKTSFGNIFSSIGTAFKNAWEGVKTTFKNVWNWILNKFNAGGTIFSGIKEGILGAFKTVVNGLIGGINTVISIPFRAINSTLNKIRSFSILGAKPFQNMWGNNPLSIPSIPKLATGAIVSSPTMAMIGEGKYEEAVIPLGQSPQFTSMKRDIAEAVAELMTGQDSGDTEVTLVVDGERFGRVAIKNINKLQRKSGTTLLKV